MSAGVDWAHTAGAAEGRAHKAERLAEWCWPRGLTGDDLAGLDPPTLRELARKAGTRPPSGETVQAAAVLLDGRAAWARQHPEHPAAARDLADERAEWVGS